MNFTNLKKKVKEKAIRSAQKVAIHQAKGKIKKLAQKHEPFIQEIREKCGKIIELEPEKDQMSIVAIVCSNILQGFDTEQEMNLTIEMIQTTIKEYWKRDDISQKEE